MNPELKLYYEQIFKFCKSVIIKSDLLAENVKKVTQNILGRELESIDSIEYGRDNPYFINLTGQYSILDLQSPIKIIDVDKQEKILNQELLNNRPWLRKKYHIYGSNFEKLVEQYPGREAFLRCIICKPFENISDAIGASDFQLVYYDDSILDIQERHSIVEALKNYIDMFKDRWAIKEFGYEELYGLSMLSVFYSQMPLFLLSKRVDNIKTQFAHTMHIWDYLSSYGLDDYRSVLTIDQQLFLYRNMDYIVKNLGKHGTLAILIEKLLNQNYLTIEPKMIINDYDYSNNTEVGLKITPNVLSRSFDPKPIADFFEDDVISIEQFLYNLFINGFISKVEYEKYKEVEDKVSLIDHTTLQTKFLELKRNFPNNPIQNFVMNMLLAGLLHFTYKGSLQFNIPVIVEELDYSEQLTIREVLLLFLFCLQKQLGISKPTIPMSLKIFPFPCNFSIIDNEVFSYSGTKKISELVNINDFIRRYKDLADNKVFYTSEDSVTSILSVASLIFQDLMCSVENNSELNQAFGNLHNQLFIYKENGIVDNNISLFDTTKSLYIKDYFENHSLLNVINYYDINLDADYDGIINQILESLFPSSIISASQWNVYFPDSHKYEKLKQLFIQLCSYNVVFVDPNIKNQITCLHAPLVSHLSELNKLIGLTGIEMLSYTPVRYQDLTPDPLHTGLLTMKGEVNDLFDKLIECRLELCNKSDFTGNILVFSNKDILNEKYIGIKPDSLIPGETYYSRVYYKSLLFDFEFIGPSEPLLFNVGKIKKPVLFLPKLVTPDNLIKIKSPKLTIDSLYVEGKIISSEFEEDLSGVNYLLKEDSVKKPTLSILNNNIEGKVISSPFEIEDILNEEGKIVSLDSDSLKLTYNHEDKHIESRWIVAKDPGLDEIVIDSGWGDKLKNYNVILKTHDIKEFYFAVQYKGKRFGESVISNVTSFNDSGIRRPTIEKVEGVYEPTSRSYFKIFSDEFLVLGDTPDTHKASRWVISANENMTKLIYDSQWVSPTDLTKLDTDYMDIGDISFIVIKDPIISIINKYLNDDPQAKTTEFTSYEITDSIKPESVFITVQYKGEVLGESPISEPYEMKRNVALRGDVQVNLILSEEYE